MKDYYKYWEEKEHKQGFKVTISEHENTDYDKIKSDNPDDWSYPVYRASYQPKGYWGGSILSVEVSEKGVNFSRSSGGDVGDIDGLEQIENFQNALRHAKKFVILNKKRWENK